MSRRLAAGAALLAAASIPAACSSWPDAADAEALSACERIAEPDRRQQCRADVIAVAEAAHRARMDELSEQVRESEAREQADQVYGGPGGAGRN